MNHSCAQMIAILSEGEISVLMHDESHKRFRMSNGICVDGERTVTDDNEIPTLFKEGNFYWMSINGNEYAMPVIYCPFCGDLLTRV